MTILLSDQIDIISAAQDKGMIYLTISDHLDWQYQDKLLLLQQKINHYLAYIESGEMALKDPQASFLNPIICLVCQYHPNNQVIEFLTKVQGIVEEAGFSFEWRLSDIESNQFNPNRGETTEWK